MDEPDVPAAPDPSPARPSPREAARQERLRREAAALRQNLRRRKGQARARAESPEADPSGADLPEAATTPG